MRLLWALSFLRLTTGAVANYSHEQEEEMMTIQDLLLHAGVPDPVLYGQAANTTQQHAIDLAASAATTTTAATSEEEESCLSVTLDACMSDWDCLVCAGTAPDYCESIEATDCESYWDLLCCTYGYPEISCQENALIIDLVGEFECCVGSPSPVLYPL